MTADKQKISHKALRVRESARSKPLMIAIGGMSGSGKSLLAKNLCKALKNAVLMDADVMRKKMFCLPPTVPLPQEAYNAANNKRFIAYIHREAAKLLQQGKSVIVTGTFSSRETRRAQENLARKNGAEFLPLYLQAPLAVLYERVAKRKNTQSDADVKILEKQASALPHLMMEWPVIRADQELECVLEQAFDAFLKHRELAKKPKPPAIG